MSSRTMATTLCLTLAFAAGPAALAQSDFGDAPDGVTAAYPPFPGVMGLYPTLSTTPSTRYPGNVGIEHGTTDRIWLGGASSVTTLEAVANVTDLDVDDSGAFWWISLTGIPAGAVLDVPVSVAADAPPGPYYLNVLIDQNNDGEWKNLPAGAWEWMIRDRLIDQAPGTTVRQAVPVWWSSSLLILPKWVRITVSDVPLGGLMTWGPDGWDGSMPPGLPLALDVGETEDRFVGGSYPGTAGAGGGPPPGPGGGGVLGGPGGGANGKGLPGVLVPGAGGACLMTVDCQPKNMTIACGDTGTVVCTIEYLSGLCPEISPGCNAQVGPRFIRHLRGAGPKAVVAPSPQCTSVGPGAARKATLSFGVTFPPPCDQQISRKQRWTFDLHHDPDGLYGTVGPGEREGIILSSAPPTCGNGFPEPPFEMCDDGNLVSGDGCAADCHFPAYFANGILEPGEECDDGNMLSGDGCSMFGIREFCGNSMLESFESCDDGNSTDGDGCNRFCQFEVPGSCGNGLVDHVLEQCDDFNTVDGDGCDAYCQTEMCGDGAIDLGEQCDDGNTANGDGCSDVCLSEGACGNGWTDAGEGCDDGNTLDEDGCSPTCQTTTIHVPDLRFLADKTTLAWGAVIEPMRRYDLLRGDLDELIDSSGDLDEPGSICLATEHTTESIATSVPAAGRAFYYVARVDPDWLAAATWEPLPPAAAATSQRDGVTTACD